MAGRKAPAGPSLLEQFSAALAKFKARRQQLVDALAEKQAERDKIVAAPQTREAVIEACERRIGAEANYFRAALGRMVEPAIQGAGAANLDLLRGDRSVLASTEVSSAMLAGLLAPAMVAAVRDYVNGVEEWPEGALPDAEREKLLKPIDAEIEELRAELDALNAELAKLQAATGDEADEIDAAVLSSEIKRRFPARDASSPDTDLPVPGVARTTISREPDPPRQED